MKMEYKFPEEKGVLYWMRNAVNGFLQGQMVCFLVLLIVPRGEMVILYWRAMR